MDNSFFNRQFRGNGFKWDIHRGVLGTLTALPMISKWLIHSTMPVRLEWHDCDVADKDSNSSQFGKSTQLSVSTEILTMKLNLFAVQALLIFVTTSGGVLFFKLVYFLAKRRRKFGLFWPPSANFSYFVANLCTFWCTHCSVVPKLTSISYM